MSKFAMLKLLQLSWSSELSFLFWGLILSKKHYGTTAIVSPGQLPSFINQWRTNRIIRTGPNTLLSLA